MSQGATVSSLVISRCGDADHQSRVLEDELARLCADAGLHVLLVPNIHDLAERSGVWDDLSGLGDRAAIVAWLYPRPTEWLLRRHGLGRHGVLALDLRGYVRAEDCFAAIRQALEAAPALPEGEGSIRELLEEVSPRWYPVVDRSLCVDCHHCFQFCLFGVYEVDEQGQLSVRNPDNCKPGCPACSRICPQGAIMFPLHDSDAAIAGAPGRLMTPDAYARRMFYVRTGTPCPVCGSSAGPDEGDTAPMGTPACQECGRRTSPPRQETVSAVEQEIDSLIEELDHLMEGDE